MSDFDEDVHDKQPLFESADQVQPATEEESKLGEMSLKLDQMTQDNRKLIAHCQAQAAELAKQKEVTEAAALQSMALGALGVLSFFGAYYGLSYIFSSGSGESAVRKAPRVKAPAPQAQ